MKNEIAVDVVGSKNKRSFVTLLLLLAIVGLVSIGTVDGAAQQRKMAAAAEKSSASKINMLTEAERSAGFKLLFDGKTTAGWRGAYQSSFPTTGWVIEDGCLKVQPGSGGEGGSGGGDIVTDKEYSNFELQLEWKLSPGGNSGIKYFVVEKQPKPKGSAIGLEMQVLDDDKHPDAKLGRNSNRTAGSLYDLIPAKSKAAKPIGEFNTARLVVQGNHVEHWLNGVKVVEYERRSPQLRELIAQSKYKDFQGFGEAEKGHILLQDHGNEVWFRNIKLRELPAK